MTESELFDMELEAELSRYNRDMLERDIERIALAMNKATSHGRTSCKVLNIPPLIHKIYMEATGDYHVEPLKITKKGNTIEGIKISWN